MSENSRLPIATLILIVANIVAAFALLWQPDLIYDFGFNPVWLRIPLAASVIWNPAVAFGVYFAVITRLGLIDERIARRLLRRSGPVGASSDRDVSENPDSEPPPAGPGSG